MLYQFADGNRGTAINIAGVTVSDANGRMLFAPAGNALGIPYATFAYVANDGEADSPPAIMTINVVLPPAPQLSAVRSGWTHNNGFQLQFSGGPNATYRIWFSIDLADWTPLGIATSPSNGWFQFIDLAATNAPQRFYRAGAP
jgi:hypothetical protein